MFITIKMLLKFQCSEIISFYCIKILSAKLNQKVAKSNCITTAHRSVVDHMMHTVVIHLTACVNNEKFIACVACEVHSLYELNHNTNEISIRDFL